MNCCGRRQVLTASGVLASGVVLGACGQGSAEETAESVSDAAATAAEGAADAAGDAVSGLAAVGDVPVGGGRVIESAQVVITQPTDGEFKAFSAVCTHQGCLVTEVRDGLIVCPCHGSQFDISSGDVVAGPARSGLAEKQVTVTGEGISVE